MATSSRQMKYELLLLTPLILLPNLFFFSRGEVILDVESSSNLFWRLSFDHVGDCLTASIQQPLDVQVVGSLAKR
jgi:hypothetical protein